MNTEIKILHYGMIISDKESGENIYSDIKKLLESNEQIVLDFEDVKTMATFNAKQIFGQLYLDLKPSAFYERIHFKNVNQDMRLLIKIGIDEALK